MRKNSSSALKINKLYDVNTRRLLIQTANRAAIRSPKKAAGKCFSSTIGFANTFAESTDLQLVRWKIIRYTDFCEHWSIGISEHEVIDLTRVQVDGKTNVLHYINSYPPNYIQMKKYPASIILQDYPVSQQNLIARSFNSAPIKIRWSMFCFDLANAPSYFKLNSTIQGFLDMGRFTWWLMTSSLMRRMKARHCLLKDRLNRY